MKTGLTYFYALFFYIFLFYKYQLFRKIIKNNEFIVSNVSFMRREKNILAMCTVDLLIPNFATVRRTVALFSTICFPSLMARSSNGIKLNKVFLTA